MLLLVDTAVIYYDYEAGKHFDCTVVHVSPNGCVYLAVDHNKKRRYTNNIQSPQPFDYCLSRCGVVRFLQNGRLKVVGPRNKPSLTLGEDS